MKDTDVLIIGGGPAGIVSASTVKQYYPDKRIILMKSIREGCIPCGIPYMFSSLKDPDEDKLGTDSLEKKGIEVVIDKALKIDRENKVVEAENNKYSYEKLILAIGSSPIVPPIPGIDKEGIYSIYKDLNYLRNVVKDVKSSKDILIMGGGFIGVEFADEISNIEGINVYLVEMLPNLLLNSFDHEFSDLVEEKLKAKGVNIITNDKIIEFLGKKRVDKVKLASGRELSVDRVILGIGAKPNVSLAVKADLDLGRCSGILVDEYMRTNDPDIFAVGDCSCKREFFTRKATPVMLASTATAEARIAGANLYKIKVVREHKGTIAIYSTYIDGLVLGSAGLTEHNARIGGFEIEVGFVEGVDKHPSTLPGVSKAKVKLVFSKQAGILLGGQVSCGMACAQLINMVGLAIQKRMSFVELETLQVATHPYLTSSPTKYPVVLAAQKISKNM